MDTKLINYMAALDILEVNALTPLSNEGYNIATVQDKSAINFLDGLALLISSDERGNVASTSQWSVRFETGESKGKIKEIKFLWASNGGKSARRTECVELLLSLIKERCSIHGLLDHMMKHCFRKVVRRCKAMARIFGIDPKSLEYVKKIS